MPRNTLTFQTIEQKIFIIRGQKVMLDSHLALLYEVELKILLRSIRRNKERFPVDFCFQLNQHEEEKLRCQIGTSSLKLHGGRRYRSYVFTENGVAMLSSILNSPRAIQVNIQIMRAFTKLRQYWATHRDLQEKIKRLERKYDKKFSTVFQAIQLLFDQPVKPVKVKGFSAKSKRHNH